MGDNGRYSLKDTLAAFVYFIPSSLVSPEAFSLLENLASYLPAALSCREIIECRLGPNFSRVDFSVKIDPSADSGREILAGIHPSLGLPDILRADVRWQRVRDFCVDWAAPGSSLHTGVGAIWLEFDVTQLWTSLPIPSLFVQTQNSTCREHPESLDQAIPEVAGIALNHLFGNPLPTQLEQTLTTCFDEMPPDAELRWLGVMLSRESGGVRLNVQFPGTQWAGVLDYLDRIGWEGVNDALAVQLEAVSDLVDVMVLLIDLEGGRVQSKLGIECMYYKNKQPEIEPRWQKLVEYLIECGLCIPEKGQALLRWSGYFHEKLGHVSEPHILNRRLDHIKLVYQPGTPAEAKGYLSFEQRPINVSRFKS